jgi:hypothetical protein
MVFEVFLEAVITILLFSGGALLIQWHKNLKKSDILLKRIGLGIIVLGFYETANMVVNLLSLSETIFFYHKIIELAGLSIIMFSLFNYLEEKK